MRLSCTRRCERGLEVWHRGAVDHCEGGDGGGEATVRRGRAVCVKKTKGKAVDCAKGEGRGGGGYL